MKLYNNIEIDENNFPPHNIDEDTMEEIPVPYLKNIPEVINISVGRQLFIDDFLIEKTDLKRREYKPVPYKDNPIFFPQELFELGKPEREWEESRPPATALFSGGVWYDGRIKKYRMWYMASFQGHIAYAESDDGIHFIRTPNDIYENNNVVLPRGGAFMDVDSIILNHYPENGMKDEYVMSVYIRPERCERVGVNVYTSTDGIHWTLRCHTAGVDDTTTVCYNPFRKKWIYSIKKSSGSAGRRREYTECDSLIEGRRLENRAFWLRADDKDIIHKKWQCKPSVYVFNTVAYESIMLGAIDLFKGPENGTSMSRGLPKVTEIHMAYSRDGFHFSRAYDRTPFISASEDENRWDMGYLHSANSICVIEGDRLAFYYSGFKGDSSMLDQEDDKKNGMYANGSIGVAYLRRDGFASLCGSGYIETRKLEFCGEYLFVNANSKNLRVQISDENGKVFKGFSFEDCLPFSSDSCKAQIGFKGKKNLSELAGKIIRITFKQDSGDIYAFWISKKPTGESGGFLAGGMVGSEGLQDI